MLINSKFRGAVPKIYPRTLGIFFILIALPRNQAYRQSLKRPALLCVACVLSLPRRHVCYFYSFPDGLSPS